VFFGVRGVVLDADKDVSVGMKVRKGVDQMSFEVLDRFFDGAEGTGEENGRAHDYEDGRLTHCKNAAAAGSTLSA
jgi:hypothetical protein